MRFKKISTQMLILILSVIIVSMLAVSLVTYNRSKVIIQKQIQENLNAKVESQINQIQLKMQAISTIANQISRSVEATYSTTDLTQYENMLAKIIYDNDLILGSGIWFEPYIYDNTQKFIGPYVYKDGTTAVTTYEYSNEEYDYFSYDWYKNAMTGSKTPVFSDLYFDDTLGVTMMSCTAPMYNSLGQFIGAVTVDIEISSIQNMINDVIIGKQGFVQLLDQKWFLYHK